LRFLKLLQTDEVLKAMMAGVPGDNVDRTPSGKDMVLGHYCRRLDFTPEEVKPILRAARYSVGGGRTEEYLDRTIRKIFEPPASRTRRVAAERAEGFGQMSARLLPGIWAKLSFIAAKLYVVMVIRCMRPSGIVRDGHTKLAGWAGIGEGSMGKAVKELVEKGLIRRKWRRGGVNYWVISPPPSVTESAVGVDDPRLEEVERGASRGLKSSGG
jgi:hypothetical protein